MAYDYWKTEEEQYLINNYQATPTLVISRILGRSRFSVSNKARRLRLIEIKRKIRPHSKDTKDKIGNSNTGKKRPDVSEANKKRLGDKSSNWKGGNNRNYVRRRLVAPIINNLEKKCRFCGTSAKLCAHHINHDWKDNRAENLMLLCRSCHSKYHRGAIKLEELKC